MEQGLPEGKESHKRTGVFEAEEILQHLWAGKCVLELILLSPIRLFLDLSQRWRSLINIRLCTSAAHPSRVGGAGGCAQANKHRPQK